MIARMLKRVGCKDVLCFSYGRPGIWEAPVSRHIAESLGYPWVFVPYTARMWKDLYARYDSNPFFAYAANLCAMPHLTLAQPEVQSFG